MNPKNPSLSVVFLLAAVLLLFAAPAQAQGGSAILLRPNPHVSSSSSESYFVYADLAPGAVVDDAVQVINTGTQAIDVVIYPADAVTASNGGLAFPTAYGDVPSRAGAWIELSESELHLQPGEVRSIPFRFTIPQDARGEIAAGIVAQPAETPQAEGQFSVTVVQRVAVTLLATIRGDEPLRAGMEIDELRADTNRNQQLVVAALHNSGDLGLHPTGALRVQDSSGQQVYQVELTLSYFLAGDRLEYNIAIEPPLPQGEYTVALNLEYEGGRVDRTAVLNLLEPSFSGEVIEFQPPAAEQPVVAAGGGVSQTLLIALGAVVVLLVVLFVLQTIRLGRARRRE